MFKSVNVTQCDDDSEIFESVMKNVGINTHALQQTTVLVDIYCYACCLSYVAVNTEGKELVNCALGIQSQ